MIRSRSVDTAPSDALKVVCPIKLCNATIGVACKTQSGIGTHCARVTKSKRLTRQTVDLFKDNRAMGVLRFVLEAGTTTLVDMKREFHRLGAVQTSIMHTFDRYFRGARFDAHPLMTRTKSGRTFAVTWIGSAGATFEERAMNWVGTLDDAQLEYAHGRVETMYVDTATKCDAHWLESTGGPTMRPEYEDERLALDWLKLVKEEIARRSLGIAKRIVASIDNPDGRRRRAIERGIATHRAVEKRMRAGGAR